MQEWSNAGAQKNISQDYFGQVEKISQSYKS